MSGVICEWVRTRRRERKRREREEGSGGDVEILAKRSDLAHVIKQGGNLIPSSHSNILNRVFFQFYPVKLTAGPAQGDETMTSKSAILARSSASIITHHQPSILTRYVF